MSDKGAIHRRGFLRVSGAAVLAAGFGCFSFPARAELLPGTICLGHLTDTRFPAHDDPQDSRMEHPGWLYEQAYALSDDLLDRINNSSLGQVSLVIHGGNLLRSGRPAQAQAVRQWLSTKATDIRLTLGRSDTGPAGLSSGELAEIFSDHGFFAGQPYYSYDAQGIRFLHLAPAAPSLSASEQEQWLREDLGREKNKPAVLIMHKHPGEETLARLLHDFPQVILVLHGGDLANRARLTAGTLVLGTCSPVIYPCAARVVAIHTESDGVVTVRSEFLQTRRLDLVEKSFHQLRQPRYIARLGAREDRSFLAQPARQAIHLSHWPVNPALAPWYEKEDSFTLAVLADTHVCLDKYVSEEALKDYELTGHYAEQGSKAIFADILEQVVSGRHRVEFYDQVFARDAEDARHYLDLPVQAMLIDGDLAEHGTRDEARVVRECLDNLPSGLRERTLVAAGNHDLWNKEFSPHGPASSRKLMADFYEGYGFREGNTHYVVRLTEWLTLIVLDSVIPTRSNMGLIQDHLDWLEDHLDQLRGQVVMIACHHPLYPITLVPPLMQAYLRARSHFDPRVTAARVQLHRMFARHDNVKLVISGHYHGVCVDQYRKEKGRGTLRDDAYTTHIQVPCTIEYPNGYRLFKITRRSGKVNIEYVTAYTRRADLRAQSSQATIFKLLGTGVKVPKEYAGTLARLSEQDNLLGELAKLNPYDLADLNVRGFKDGTANLGRGNTGRNNINGQLELSFMQ